MKFEANLLDKIISKGLLGRRQLGRPLKHNFVNKWGRGIFEAMYTPRSQFEAIIGKTIHSLLPLLSYYTYRFHVERTRAAGLRIEDHYEHKFFREPYITWHIYAQNFHPWTLNERVRNIHFYRKTKTLFKGFKVPDWAQSHRSEGWDVDVEYSRQAWDQAMHDFRSEWTPSPFRGERLEPNALNWFRFEQVGKGFSSRFFYNEIPNPTFHRHGGHFDDPQKSLYSFKYADQHHQNVLGFDTSTEAGRKGLEAEIQRWKIMTPEIHEASGIGELASLQKHKFISQEPHFQRVLTHYRAYVIQNRIQKAVEQGDLFQDDVNAARQYFDENGLPSATMIEMGRKGFLDGDAWYSFEKVLEVIGLGDFQRNPKTSKPIELQLVTRIDEVYKVTEKKLNEALPIIISDERQRERIQSLLEQGADLSGELPQEQSRSLGQ